MIESPQELKRLSEAIYQRDNSNPQKEIEEGRDWLLRAEVACGPSRQEFALMSIARFLNAAMMTLEEGKASWGS